MDSDEEHAIMDKLDEALNLAEDIDDVLIPDALHYYLGLNDDYFDQEDMGDEEDDDDEDEDDEDKDDK